MLVIVGGSQHFNKLTGRRECMNDVLVYNPADSHWTELACTGITFEHRRYHSACVLGRYLVVFGGINSFDMPHPPVTVLMDSFMLLCDNATM